MPIVINQFGKGSDGTDHRLRVVSMPFQVAAHPIDLPCVGRLHVGGLGHCNLLNMLRVVPNGADLHNCHVLPVNAVTEVELRPDMLGRSVFFEELLHGLNYFEGLMWGECHGSEGREGLFCLFFFHAEELRE